MTRVALAIGLLVLAALGAALAQEKQEEGLPKGTFAPDIEAKEWLNTPNGEALSLTELRGMVVVVFFWVTWHKGGELVMPLMNEINSKFARNEGVFLVGLTDADRKRVEGMLKKERAFFPVGLESRSYEEYKIRSFPSVVVIDARGRVCWTGWPGQADALVKAIADAISDVPPSKTHPEEAAIVQSKLKKARQALLQGKYREAYLTARDADRIAIPGDPLKTRCQDMLDLLEALGHDLLARARQASEEQDWETSVNLLRTVRREYLGLAVATRAKRLLDNLKKKSPEVARILERENEAAEAENALGKALELIRNKRLGEGYVRLEDIVTRYEGTEAATKARTVLERMQRNEGIMGYVRDHKAAKECENLLRLAETYARSQRVQQAKELYRRIINEYADTVWAEEATRRLMRLP